MFEIANKISPSRLEEILTIVKAIPLRADVSSYAKGRQRTWLNVRWDLKNKIFDREDDCCTDRTLWTLLKEIWPEAEVGLLTYSGDEDPKGIHLHRDDMYADYESYGIQLSGTCEFVYMGGYKNFYWEQERNSEEKKTYMLNPGEVFRFNCKNRHAAYPSVGRYAINLWKVSPKFKEQYKESIKQNISLF